MSQAHDLYRRWLAELWNGSSRAAGQLVSADFTGHWPDRDVTGPAELAEIIEQTHNMFTQLSFTLQVGPIVEDDLVAGRWIGQGQTADGPMSFVGNDLLRIRDGLFVEYWVASSAAPDSLSRGSAIGHVAGVGRMSPDLRR